MILRRVRMASTLAARFFAFCRRTLRSAVSSHAPIASPRALLRLQLILTNPPLLTPFNSKSLPCLRCHHRHTATLLTALIHMVVHITPTSLVALSSLTYMVTTTVLLTPLHLTTHTPPVPATTARARVIPSLQAAQPPRPPHIHNSMPHNMPAIQLHHTGP